LSDELLEFIFDHILMGVAILTGKIISAGWGAVRQHSCASALPMNEANVAKIVPTAQAEDSGL
jgi:hypothetical protein